MKTNRITAMFLLIGAFMIFVSAAYAGKGEETDKTLSPYFFIKSDDPETDQTRL